MAVEKVGLTKQGSKGNLWYTRFPAIYPKKRITLEHWYIVLFSYKKYIYKSSTYEFPAPGKVRSIRC